MIPVELVAIFALMQAPETRAQGRTKLADYAGVAQVLLFGKDAEIGLFLPATGQPQTLRDGARWQRFLQDCGQGSAAPMPDPSSAGETVAYGITDVGSMAAIVFLGSVPGTAILAQIAALLPLLGAKLVLERNLLAADGHAKAAREASRRAGALNEALEVGRRELQNAYQKAECELASRRIAEQKLLDTDKRKDEFLAMLAHELRNPLAPISMAAHVLKRGSVDTARLTQSCDIIERQVGHMTRLLDDLLDVSRVTGGMVTLATDLVNLGGVISEALEQALPLINARGHRLSVALPEVDVFVTGDRTRLVQIATNLLNNAAKYTAPKGEISVALDRRGNDATLTVRDDGIGIDAELLTHVFDLFIQGERSPDRSQGGLGLGLALVKSLVERHGGTVLARSAGKGMGSEFEVRIPIAQQATPDGEGADDAPAYASKALSILVVDDNEDAANTLALYLRAIGHQVCATFCGTSALEMAQQLAPRVLVLDIGLPDMDGCLLAIKLRELPQTRQSLLIALTGYGHEEDRERSQAAGFDYHLTKPVDPLQLDVILRSVATQDAMR